METQSVILIQTESTPNPDVYKFVTNQTLFTVPGIEVCLDDELKPSGLIQELFRFPLSRIYLAGDFIAVEKKPEADWTILAAQIRQTVRNWLSAGKPIFETTVERTNHSPSSHIQEQINSWLFTTIVPATNLDGGAMVVSNIEGNTVTIKALGACKGCPYVQETLQKGVLPRFVQQFPDFTVLLDESF
ncbi:MAG: NifU family protein [Bacteroidia bacterium]|nr:NifU family protein [Bacteroidia bacterium]